MKPTVRLLWCALGLAVAEPAWADTSGDERYLALEEAERFQAQMKAFGALDGPIIEVADRRALPALIVRGTSLLEQIFDDPAAKAFWLRALSEVKGAVPVELEGVGERMRAVQQDIGTKSIEELQGLEAEWTARYEARPDRAAIDAVSTAMASPDLAAETALTGRRVKWGYEAVLTMDLDAVKDLGAEERREGIREILEMTRIPEEPGYTTPLNVDLASRRRRELTRMVLSRLPANDIDILVAFYDSPSGRAKRNALVEAFRLQNDTQGAAFIERLLDSDAAQTTD